MQKSSTHIITFLRRIKTFSQVEGISSMLQVDAKNTVEDVFDNAEFTGGLIADIDNAVSEIEDKLEEYYKSTGNKKLLSRLKKLQKQNIKESVNPRTGKTMQIVNGKHIRKK